MPVYYFDWVTSEGERTPDYDGVLCRDINDAKQKAAEALKEWTNDGNHPEVIEVRDRPGGETVCVVSLRPS